MRTPLRLVASFVILLMLGACGQFGFQKRANRQVSNGGVGTTTENPTPTQGGASYVHWGDPQMDMVGMGEDEEIFESIGSGNERWKDFCFENNNPCRRASSSVSDVVLNRPVAIQSFQLAINSSSIKVTAPDANSSRIVTTNKNITNVAINGAWLKTARLQFCSSSGNGCTVNLPEGGQQSLKPGEAFFANPQTIEFGSCNLSESTANANKYTNSNSVGFDHSARGQERFLTGLYMMDNADTNVDSSGFGFFENAHLWAGRAWYSGLVGVNDGVNPLRFDWVPLGGSDPERENFGRRSFQSAGGVYTQVFGQQLSDWKDRVITGFCINGTKTLEGGDVLPLFLWAKFRTYRPELRPK